GAKEGQPGPLADSAPTDPEGQRLVTGAGSGERQALETLVGRHQTWSRLRPRARSNTPRLVPTAGHSPAFHCSQPSSASSRFWSNPITTSLSIFVTGVVM